MRRCTRHVLRGWKLFALQSFPIARSAMVDLARGTGKEERWPECEVCSGNGACLGVWPVQDDEKDGNEAPCRHISVQERHVHYDGSSWEAGKGETASPIRNYSTQNSKDKQKGDLDHVCPFSCLLSP
jgi:hypothetical protein